MVETRENLLNYMHNNAHNFLGKSNIVDTHYFSLVTSAQEEYWDKFKLLVQDWDVLLSYMKTTSNLYEAMYDFSHVFRDAILIIQEEENEIR